MAVSAPLTLSREPPHCRTRSTPLPFWQSYARPTMAVSATLTLSRESPHCRTRSTPLPLWQSYARPTMAVGHYGESPHCRTRSISLPPCQSAMHVRYALCTSDRASQCDTTCNPFPGVTSLQSALHLAPLVIVLCTSNHGSQHGTNPFSLSRESPHCRMRPTSPLWSPGWHYIQ